MKFFHYLFSLTIALGRWCSSSRQTIGQKNRNTREASAYVQNTARRRVLLRLSDRLWRWQIDRFRSHLRHTWLCQKVRAQAQTSSSRTCRSQKDGAQTTQGEKEPHEEGERHEKVNCQGCQEEINKKVSATFRF